MRKHNDEDEVKLWTFAVFNNNRRVSQLRVRSKGSQLHWQFQVLLADSRMELEVSAALLPQVWRFGITTPNSSWQQRSLKVVFCHCPFPTRTFPNPDLGRTHWSTSLHLMCFQLWTLEIYITFHSIPKCPNSRLCPNNCLNTGPCCDLQSMEIQD